MAKKKKGKVVQMLSPENYIRQKARALPLFECYINSDWKESGMASITVARKHSNGNITMGMYLTDLKCLGIKDAYYFFNISEREYRDILENMAEEMDTEPVSYTLAHNIIYAGIEFADDYKFKPHKDFTSVAQYILEEDNEDVELIEVECGENGKPLYIRGPLDSETRASKIITQLEREAGPGNYKVIWQTEEDFMEDVWDKENDEKDEEDNWDQWDELGEKYKDFSFEEKLNLITESFIQKEKLSDKENEELVYLMNSVIYTQVDFDLADEISVELTKKLLNYEITDEFSDEILGIKPGSNINREKWEKQFYKLNELATKKPKSAGKKIKKLQKEMADNPALAYLELLTLQALGSPDYEEKLNNYFKQFPEYPLIKIFWKTSDQLKNEHSDLIEFIKTGPAQFFEGKELLHQIEVFQYLFSLILLAGSCENISLIEAVEGINDEMDFLEDMNIILSEVIYFMKMSFILSLNAKTEAKVKTIAKRETYQFKIQLKGITHPPVWRRITVPSNYSFYAFHRIIQEAFGWWNSHLFQFSENGFGSNQVITEIYEDIDTGFEEQLDAEEIYLSDVFHMEKQKFVYIYDLGDSWEHIITLEKILPEKTLYPDLLAGKGQCPPEDCGGVWGYENFKEIMADKNHPEYEEYAEWVGLEEDDEWNPKEFDLKGTQSIIKEMFKNK